MSTGGDAAFFEACIERAQAALQQQARWHAFGLAGRTVRVGFANAALEPALLPALRSLAIAGNTNADLTLLAWDSRSTGLEPPAAPWEGGGFASWWRARAHRDHDVDAYLCGHGTFSLFDRRRALGVYWVRGEDHVPPWDRAAPFRSLLGAWAATFDGALLHAASVSDGDAAVLLTAKGGSGKSTTAMSCTLDGMEFLGEDYVLVEGVQTPRVHRLYSTAKLDAAALARAYGSAEDARIPERISPGPRPADFDHAKTILQLDAAQGVRLRDSARVRAITVPQVAADAVTRHARLPGGAVLRALAPTTLLQLPFAGASTFARLSALTQAVPGYALQLGRERASIVGALRELVHGA